MTVILSTPALCLKCCLEIGVVRELSLGGGVVQWWCSAIGGVPQQMTNDLRIFSLNNDGCTRFGNIILGNNSNGKIKGF